MAAGIGRRHRVCWLIVVLKLGDDCLLLSGEVRWRVVGGRAGHSRGWIAGTSRGRRCLRCFIHRPSGGPVRSFAVGVRRRRNPTTRPGREPAGRSSRRIPRLHGRVGGSRRAWQPGPIFFKRQGHDGSRIVYFYASGFFINQQDLHVTLPLSLREDHRKVFPVCRRLGPRQDEWFFF